jgi:hypothetical protein
MPRKSKHSLSILHHLAGSKLFLKVAGVFTFTNSWSNTASATKSGATFPTRGSENSRDCSTAQKQRNKSGMRDKITHIRKQCAANTATLESVPCDCSFFFLHPAKA